MGWRSQQAAPVVAWRTSLVQSVQRCWSRQRSPVTPSATASGVGRPSATATGSRGGSALLPASRQDTPGVSGAEVHQRGSLAQRHVLCQQAVQNLKSRLFRGSQSHLLHRGKVTFMLVS